MTVAGQRNETTMRLKTSLSIFFVVAVIVETVWFVVRDARLTPSSATVINVTHEDHVHYGTSRTLFHKRRRSVEKERKWRMVLQVWHKSRRMLILRQKQRHN